MAETFLIILLAVFFAWVAWWKLDWAITLCVLFLPTYLLRFQVWFVPMTILEVMVLVVFLVWVVKQIQKSKIKNQNFGIWWPWKWLTILWVLAGIVAVLISPDTRQALGLWKAYILEPVLFFIVFVNTIKTRQQIQAVLWALGALTVIIGFVALLQYIGLVDIPSPYGTQTPMRATSVFPFPTAVGKLLAPIVALFLGLLLSRPARQSSRPPDFIRQSGAVALSEAGGGIRGYQEVSGGDGAPKKDLRAGIFPWGVAAFGAMALIFSFPRGAIIGVLAALIFVSFFSRWKKRLWAGIILIIIVSLLVPFTRHELTSIVSTKDTSADVHVVMWKGAIRIIKANPILGTGLASFPIVYEKYKEASHTEFFPNPDHLILTLWIEMGLVGLVLFAWIVIRFFKTGVRILRSNQEPRTQNQEPRTKNQEPEINGPSSKFKVQSSKLAVALMAAMVALLAHGLFDTPYFKNDLAIVFWALVGMLLMIDRGDWQSKRA